mgnify:CR=1 FL=1
MISYLHRTMGLAIFFTMQAESFVARAETTDANSLPIAVSNAANSAKTLAKLCYDELKIFSGHTNEATLKAACEKVEQLDGCTSVENQPIFHYNRTGSLKEKRILVVSLIHGDETPAGSVGRFWMERLQTIDPRNTWRIIPILNPDGVKRHSRTNANNIDLNRNFPTLDWEEQAQSFWKKFASSSPRKFPGNNSGSEPETKCALAHIADFKPTFVVSIHTPLKVLDFDGPKVKPPPYAYLPWKSLGHFPGSLGRYMWHERKVPVLTTELKEELPNSIQPLESLQDVIGTLVKMEL